MPPPQRNLTTQVNENLTPREPVINMDFFNFTAPKEEQVLLIQQQPWFHDLMKTLDESFEEKYNKLETKYKKLDREANHLKEQVKNLGDENAKLKERLVAFALNDNVFDFFRTIPQLMREQQETKINQSNNKFQEKFNELQDDYDYLKEQYKKEKQRTEELQRMITKQEEEHSSQMNTMNTQFSTQIDTMKNQIKLLTEEQENRNTEKEALLKKTTELVKERDQLNDSVSLLKTQNDPALLMNDFSDNTVKSIQDEYQSLKNDLNSLVNDIVEELKITNDQKEIEIDFKLSEILFKSAKKVIFEQFPDTAQKQVGKLLKSESLKRSAIGWKLADSMEAVENCGMRLSIKKTITELVSNALKFYENMFSIDKSLELIWPTIGSQFNPEQFDSRNGMHITTINSVFRPALMNTSNRAVYEKGIVETKERKRK